MKILISTTLVLMAAVTATARPIRYWPYSNLVEQADLVAVVEVVSITNSADALTAHGDTRRFQAKTARLKIAWIIKGQPIDEATLLFFTYSSIGQSEPNGGLFIAFDEPDKHQYLVFLKKEGDRFIPVTGHYDASISVKSIRQDHFSAIRTR